MCNWVFSTKEFESGERVWNAVARVLGFRPLDQHGYQEQPEPRQIFAIAKPRTTVANIPLNQTDSRRRSKLTAVLGSLSLYVFMSLQR